MPLMRTTVLVAFLLPSCLAIPCLLAACGSQPPPVSNADQADQPAPAGTLDGSAAPPASDPAPAADITLVSLDGTMSPFDAHRAPVTVVALWATYCAPCLRELPLVEALHRKYRGQDDVTVLLVSVDDLDEDSRDAITRILQDRSMTVPAFIDHRHRLMDRLAPRDRQGRPYQAVPMLVVVDREFRLRRKLELANGLDEDVFLSELAPLVDAARQNQEVPPDEPYDAPLGSGFTGKRIITLTVDNLAEKQIAGYVRNLRPQLAGMYPDLHDHQLDDVLAEIEKKLRAQGGGDIKVEIPAGHAGAH